MNKKNHQLFNEIELWSTNRRKFIKSIGVAAVLSQIAILPACNQNKKKYFSNEYLTATQAEILQKVQEILFPNDGNGPSCENINAYGHFLWVLSDKRKNDKSKQYLINGIDWVNEAANENFNLAFTNLTIKQTHKLIESISKTSWGENWLSMILTLIFEALSLDPIYNINTNQKGWQWLNQYIGSPRPSENIAYNNIFKTIHAE